MVAIFTGSGAGFERGSGSVLGGAGLLGSGALGRSGEQVSLNAATGNLLISQRDEFLVGLGTDATIARTYNSLGDASDENGDNWRQSTDRRVYGLTGTVNTSGSTVKRVAADGSEVTYGWNGTSYVATDGAGAYDALRYDGAAWTWTDGDSQDVETYANVHNGQWRITAARTRTGYGLTFTYNGAQLDRVTTLNGEYVQYGWSGANITQIVTGYTDLATNTAKTLTRTRYGYDGANRLTSVTVDLSPEDNAIGDGKTYVTTYSYDGSSKRVASVSQTDGSRLDIGYDQSGRVIRLTQATLGASRVTDIAYNPGYTTIRDSFGQITRLDYNANGSLAKVIAPAAYAGATAQVSQFGYDSAGNLTSVTDPLGAATAYTYDGSGNVLTTTDPLGNVVTRTYDGLNNVLTETRIGSDADGHAANHTTRYAYSGKNLVYSVSAEGIVTRYFYTSDGQVSQARRFTEQRYDVSTLSPSTSIDFSTLSVWDGSVADRSTITMTTNSFDSRGNMMSTRGRGSATSTGESINGDYAETSYVYDQSGQLLSSTTAGLNTERFVYDGLGRVIASTDLNGATTSIVFNDAASRTVVTAANGYVQTSTYSVSGELISSTDSGAYVNGGTANYAYDREGRLRSSQDATGNYAYSVYDAVSRKVADVDHYGALTEYRYDAGDRVIATIRYAVAITAAQISRLQNVADNVDLASIRPASSAGDLVTRTVHDADGRVIQAVAGDGSVTEYRYDGSSRLVETIAYVNRLSAGQLAALDAAPASAVLPTPDSARDSVARNFFDKDGRTIGVLDGEGYLARTIYDAAGRAVAQTGFATATATGLRATGSFAQLLASAGTSAADRTTRSVYDGQGLLRFSIDAQGNVSEFVYKGAADASANGVVRQTIQFAVPIGVLARYTVATVQTALSSQAGSAANRTDFSVYDSANRLAYAIDASGAVTGFSYDADGRQTKTTQFANIRVTTTLPSLADMAVWQAANTNSANRITRSFYTARDELLFTVDAEGYITRYDYDKAGRLVATWQWDKPIAANDATTTNDVVTAVLTGTYVTTTILYDRDGRVIATYEPNNVARAYFYNANGTLLFDIADYGYDGESRTAYVYDANGRVIQAYEAHGSPEQRVTQYSYDGLGNVVSTTDARGNTTTFTYDRDGRKLTSTDALGGVTRFQYDAFGSVVKTTDPRGNATYAYYDTLGRAVTTRDAEDYVTETSYTTFGEVASTTRRANRATNAASVTSVPVYTADPAKDVTTSFAYDRLGRVVSSTDALGFFETYGNDAFGNLTSVTAKSATGTVAVGLATTYSYDRRGQLLSETLPAPTYDSAGNQVSAAIISRYEYDARGNRTKEVEADNLAERRTTIYVYDKNDRLIETRHDAVSIIADDLVTTFPFTPVEYAKYDSRGNIVETTDAAGARTLFYYDDLDRKTVEIVQTSAIDNRYSTFSYDANGNVTLVRVYSGSVTLPSTVTATPPAPPAGAYRESSFTYDALNRQLTSRVSGVVTGSLATGYGAADLITTSQYDANGNVVKVTDPNGGTTYFWYDALSRKTAQVDAEGALTTWTYDLDGNVIAEMRFANRVNTQAASQVSLSALVTTPQSIAVTALIASTWYNGEDRYTTNTYDKVGNRLSETRYSLLDVLPSGAATTNAGYTAVTVSYLYNGLGQVIRKTEATSDQTEYVYDGAGRLVVETRAAFTDFNGQSVSPTTSYRYDGLGNLSRAVQSGAGGAAARATTYSYGGGGRLASMTDAAGFTRSYAYDAMGRVKREQYTRVTAAGGAVTEALATRYDLAGRTTYQGTAAWNGSGFSVVDYGQTQYNGFGDVWRQGSNGQFQTENSYDNAGRLTATTAGDGIWKFFGYDRNGNQTVAITSAGTSLAGQSFASALSMVGSSTVNATYTSYEKRNLAVQVVEEGRQLSDATTEQLVTARAYNAFGEVASETNAQGATINYSYNNMGKLVKVENPTVSITLENGATQDVRPTEIYYYDVSGRLTGTRSANGAFSRQTLLAGTGYGGSAALTVASIAADGGVTTNGYDIHGDIRRVTDQIGRVTIQTFDAMGRVTEIAHAGGLVEGFAYDGLGQRIQTWNNQFQTEVYGQPVNVWVADGGHWDQQTPIVGYTPQAPIYGAPTSVWVSDGGYWQQQTPIVGYTPQTPIYGEPTQVWIADGGHWEQQLPIIGYSPQTPIYGQAQQVWIGYGGHWAQHTPILGYTPQAPIYGEPTPVWIADGGHWELQSPIIGYTPPAPIYGQPTPIWIGEGGHWEQHTPILGYTPQTPIYGEPTPVWIGYGGHWEQQTVHVGYTPSTPIYGEPQLVWVSNYPQYYQELYPWDVDVGLRDGYWDWQTPIIGYTPSEPIYSTTNVWVAEGYSGHWEWQTPFLGYTQQTPIYGETVNVWVAESYTGRWEWQTPLIGYTPQTPIYGAATNVWVAEGYSGHWEWQTPLIGYTPQTPIYGAPVDVWVAENYSGHWEQQIPITGYLPEAPIYGAPVNVWVAENYSGRWEQQISITGYTPATPIYGATQTVWINDAAAGHWEQQTPIIGYSQPTPIYGPVETVWVADNYSGHWEQQTQFIGYGPDKALTEYDALGRVISQRAFGGDVTTTSYAWDAGIATSGVGTFGGWAKTTTVANGRTSVERSDAFGRATAKTDLGGHVWSYSYDVAGRLTAAGTSALATGYSYFNSGQLASTITGTINPAVNTNWSRTVATYSYDRLGQRLTEQTSEETGIYTPGHWQNDGNPNPFLSLEIPDGNSYWVEESYTTSSFSLQNSVASYDALGRLKTFVEIGSSASPAASIAYQYDAAGNIRRTTASYRSLDAQGVASGAATTTDYWFRFDNMNRIVTDKGALQNGQIVRGAAGQDFQYNAAGERVAVLRTDFSPGYYDPETGYYSGDSVIESRENYTYDTAGRVIEVRQAFNGGGGGTLRSRFSYDLVGRQTGQSDYQANGTTVVFSRSASYNGKSQLVADDSTTRKSDGVSYRAVTTYDYGSGSAYALGSALSIATINYKNNNDGQAPDTLTMHSYSWWDGAVQSQITHKPNTAQATTYYTGLIYNGLGQLTRAEINDGRVRSVKFRLNTEGQVLRRDEADTKPATGDPHEVWYRFNGRQLGYTGNNGTSEVSTAASIAEREQVSPTTPGAFRNGQTAGTPHADFTNSDDPINSYAQGSTGGSYTVRSGDTLAGIAQAIWGDASLWYKLAEANGLSGSASLTQGTTLVLPAGVVRSTYNANTLEPYNPADAIGDLTPNTPNPQAPKKNKCGVFGLVLLAVIAIAVAAIAGPAIIGAASTVTTSTATVAGIGAISVPTITAATGLTAVLGGIGAVAGSAAAIGAGVIGGAIAGAAASVVSQGVGVALGIQEKFSWSAVALAGLSGGIGAGLGGVIPGGGIVANVGRGVAGSALTQGVAVATGLQSKFDFVGVAAAGIGAGVGGALGRSFRAPLSGAAQFGQRLAVSTASGLANAATRSAIEGSSFGDNIIAALPDIIGQAVGGYIAGKVDSIGRRSAADTPNTLIDPQTGQKIVVGAALADQINLRRDGQRIDAEIAAGIRNSDGSLRDGGPGGGAASSGTAADGSGRPPGDYLNPERRETFSRSINEYWRKGFEATNAAHRASVGHEYTDAPDLRKAYAERDAYLAKLDAYATQMVDKPIGLALGTVVATAATAGTGTVVAGYFGITGWGAFGAGVVTDGLAAGNGGLFYHPLVGERNSFGSYGRDVLSGAAGSGALRVLGKGVSWGVGKFGSGGSIAAERVAVGEGGAASRFTFRGDSRGPDVIFNEGFAPRGSSTDLLAHAYDNTLPPSAFVPTSRSADVAAGFADNVYVVRSTNGIDVNRVLGPASPFPNELEIAIPGRVLPGNVRAVTIPNHGVSILNPNYKP